MKSATILPSIASVGVVTFDPQRVARVGTRLRGLIRSVRHYEGDVVKRGVLLATVDSPELGEAQAAVASLQAELDAAQRNAEREGQLATERLTTSKESEAADTQARRYRAQLAAAKQRVTVLAEAATSDVARGIGVHAIAAPLSGTVVERHISVGQLVDGEETAFLIANLDTLWIELAVFEKRLPLIRVGDKVILHPLGNPSTVLTGRVANVGQVLDAATRSAAVRIEVPNDGRQLRPGQVVDAVITCSGASGEAAPIVPREAVSLYDGMPNVFIGTSPTSARITEVELGPSDGSNLQIRRGIEVGDWVVVNGAFELKSELFR